MKLRAIFFDLDDTLIDTSGLLIEPGHRRAAQAMVEAGLRRSPEVIYQRRRHLVPACRPEQLDDQVVRSFGLIEDAEPGRGIAEAGRRAWFGELLDELGALPWVHEVLAEVGAGRSLILVTAGDDAAQRRKVDLCGLGRHFDEVVVVASAAAKQEAFAALLAARGLEPPEVLVVGDRADGEIEAARRLGMWAARVTGEQPEGALPLNPWQQPHYSVSSGEVVPAVVADIEAGDDEP